MAGYFFYSKFGFRQYYSNATGGQHKGITASYSRIR